MFGYLRDQWHRRRIQRWQKRLLKHQVRIAREREAARTPLEWLDPLVRELVEMGNTSGYHNDRTREIGELLNELGGLGHMQDVYYEVFNWHPVTARDLQQVWDGVGDWRA